MQMSRQASKICSLFLLALFISGCATFFSLRDRYASGDSVSTENHFNKSFIKTDRFTLTAYSRFTRVGAPIHIYIEGDGVSWVSRTQLSDDPTPSVPLVLELAAIDPAENVAYIARPGQYSASGVPQDDPSYWSNKRFSEEVIASMNEAVNRLSRQAGTNEIDLIGYSGGAAVAVLIAARRSDITGIRTVAGNLDPEEVNRYHNVSPLSGSLNPLDAAGKIKNIPQRHFVGSNDKVVPLSITQSFVSREGDANDGRITVVDGATHTKGWQKRWEGLLLLPLSSRQGAEAESSRKE
jgi:hypothetical protein